MGLFSVIECRMGGSEHAKSPTALCGISRSVQEKTGCCVRPQHPASNQVSRETLRLLERELPRKLKDSWIERGVDLAKVGVVDA